MFPFTVPHLVDVVGISIALHVFKIIAPGILMVAPHTAGLPFVLQTTKLNIHVLPSVIARHVLLNPDASFTIIDVHTANPITAKMILTVLTCRASVQQYPLNVQPTQAVVVARTVDVFGTTTTVTTQMFRAMALAVQITLLNVLRNLSVLNTQVVLVAPTHMGVSGTIITAIILPLPAMALDVLITRLNALHLLHNAALTHHVAAVPM